MNWLVYDTYNRVMKKRFKTLGSACDFNVIYKHNLTQIKAGKYQYQSLIFERK